MFQEIIAKTLKKIAPEATGYQISFAPEKFGDYTTNLALMLAKKEGKNPLAVGEEIRGKLAKDKSLKKIFSEIKLVKPGFINFYLHPGALSATLGGIIKAQDKFGAADIGQDKKINIEFVSANPTGPLTLGNGRSASFGESLARLLGLLGYRVTKEYYLNDIGRQVALLGESVARRYLEISGKTVDFPEEMYQGEYITEIAKDFKKEGLYHGSIDDFEGLSAAAQEYAIAKMIRAIKEVLIKFDVRHDVWFRESELAKKDNGEILNFLETKGWSYEKEGALWFKATEFGLDQDVVIRRSNGLTTYLLSDFAYARHKAREFDRMVYVLGADHHGDVARIRTGLRALGLDENRFEFLVYQLVTLREEGERVRMSKRAGKIVTLEHLLEEVPADVAKFFFLAKSMDSHIDFDLALAKEESNKNPVYYIQYAYVRMLNIIKKAREQKIKISARVSRGVKWQAEETTLAGKLTKFPEVLEKIGENFQIHHLATYVYELAELTNRFYEKDRVIGAAKGMEKARLTLVQASAIVLRNALYVLGLSMPEKM